MLDSCSLSVGCNLVIYKTCYLSPLLDLYTFVTFCCCCCWGFFCWFCCCCCFLVLFCFAPKKKKKKRKTPLCQSIFTARPWGSFTASGCEMANGQFPGFASTLPHFLPSLGHAVGMLLQQFAPWHSKMRRWALGLGPLAISCGCLCMCLSWSSSSLPIDLLSPVNHKHLNLFVRPWYENPHPNFSTERERLIKCVW